MNRNRLRRMMTTVLSGGGGAAPFVGAYDAIPNLVHIYEPARRTLSAYTGSLLRLRRSSDNAESDFGYVEATGELDTAAIATWLSAATGYIKTIYDQKGSDNITQATTSAQPLYTASAQNGHAGGTFDGVGDLLVGAFTNGGALSQPYSIYAVCQLDASAVNDGSYHSFFDADDLTNRNYAGQYPVSTPDAWQMAGSNELNDSASDSNWNLWSMVFNGATSQFWINNTPKLSGNGGIKNIDGLTLGGWAGTWKGPIASFVIADPVHTDDQRLAMQTAINSYWEIYLPFEEAPLGADFSIVHFPDTQTYVTAERNYIFQAMTQWVADHQVSENIQLVVHTGDFVIPANASTWSYAKLALNTIDVLNIPFFSSVGNHDYEDAPFSNIPASRPLVDYNANFGTAFYEAKSWWAGGWQDAGKSENGYLLITLGGQDYIILALDFGPRQATLDWANTILTTYADRDAILLIHTYMFRDTTRCTTGDDWNPKIFFTDASDVHDGEEIWQELVKLHSNIVQVWSGHDRGINYLQSIGDGGNIVTQILDAHDMETGHFVLAKYYLATNKVHYARYMPNNGVYRVDWAKLLDYKTP